MAGPMLLVYPVPGDTTNVWATVLNTLLGLVENHDHSPGKGNLVPSAGIGINADLTFASFAGTNLKAIAFTEVAASSMVSYVDALYVNSTDHNLYFLNSNGVSVQLTEGNTINLSLSGGIGGDYAAVNALLSYDDATHRYLFQQEGTPRPWAGAAMGNLDIYEQAASISNHVTIKSPSALGASYSMTLPTGLPAGPRPMYVDNAGAMTTSAGMTRIGRQVFTANGTYTPTTGTRAVLLRLVSGGGGGGGAAGGTGSSAGGGGCSGVFVEKWISSASALTGGAVTVGAGGSGGANTGGNGGTGGATTVVIGATTYQADGGGGGTGMAASTENVAAGGVWNILYSYGPDDYLCVQPGQVGVNVGGSSFLAVGGAGGSNPLGAGGYSQAIHTGSSSLAGILGIGYGGGGSGAVMYGSDATGAAGGDGASGLIIIDEFM